MHAGFSGFRRFVARKKSWCKPIGYRFVIPHDTIPSNVSSYNVKRPSMKRTILHISGLLILSACNNQAPKDNYTYPSNNTYTPPQSYTIDTSSYFKNNSVDNYPVFDNSQRQYKQRVSYTLQDFWNEADDLRNEAENLLSEAEEIGCDDAISCAQNAISYCDDCTSTNNYNDAESYLSDAQSELENARSYFDECQDNRENSDEEENEEENEYE